MIRSNTGWLWLGSVLVLALAVVTPVTYARGGDPTLIHACVNKSSGEVKIVGANASCKSNETALDWPKTSAALGGGSIIVHGGSFGACEGCSPVVILRTGGGAAEYRLPRDGTIQNMRIRIISNSYDGPAVVTLFVNGNPAVSTTIPAGSTTDIDVPGTVDVFDGDRVSVMMDQSAISSFGSMEIGVSYEIL